MPLNKVNADSIADGTIIAADIADGTITLAKLQSGLLPSAIANSGASYANAAFATANTGTASGSYANSAFAAANTVVSASSYANSAFSAANGATATDATQNTNISSAASYANAAFSQANTGGVTSIVAGTGISINQGTGAVTVTNSSTVNASQLAKAWANWAGSSGTINSSFNVSSVTRNSTGVYTVNITSALTNANYAVICGTSSADGNNDGGWMGIKNGTTLSTTSFQLATDGRATGEYDPTYAMVAVFTT